MAGKGGEQVARHRWSHTGPWAGSRDVRECVKCSASARKTGMYSGWRLRVPDGPWMYFERLPACPWPEGEVGGEGAK